MSCVTESPLQEGRRYQSLVDNGMTVDEIAEELSLTMVNHINHRLALVRICDERQMTSSAIRA
jgi:hypothetical protein